MSGNLPSTPIEAAVELAQLAARIGELDRKNLKSVVLQDPRQIAVQIVGELQFSQTRLDRGFPDARDADTALPRFIEHCGFCQLSEIRDSMEKTDPTICINQVFHM